MYLLRPLATATFYNTFDIKNLSLFTTKYQNQCEKCANCSVGRLSEQQYAIDQVKEEEARKKETKYNEEGKIVCTINIQTVLMAPKSQISNLYHRTKLQFHNLIKRFLLFMERSRRGSECRRVC